MYSALKRAIHETLVYKMHKNKNYRKIFLTNVKGLSTETLKLIHENKDFVKSIQIDNQNKLRIIHDHHPKALEYFISKK